MAKRSAKRKDEPALGKGEVSIEVRKLADLKADPKNAKRHSEQQIGKIADAIERFGYVNMVAVRPDGTIIGGHATAEALRRLEREDAEVRVVAGLNETQYRALGLALNKLPEESSWDDDVLAEALGEIEGAGENLGGLGFSDREIARILKGDDDPIEVKEIETSTVEDEFWISVRGPLADQAQALKALQTLMKQFPSVTVELGTISVG